MAIWDSGGYLVARRYSTMGKVEVARYQAAVRLDTSLDAFGRLVVRLALGVCCDRTSFIRNEGSERNAGFRLHDV
jgi:hypothetical protein